MKKILSTLLTLCMLVTLLGMAPGNNALAINSDVDQQTSTSINNAFDEDILSEAELSKYIDYQMALDAKHVERLYDEETLSTIVYRNADNTKTVYFYDDEIKFVNSNGVVVEKDIELSLKNGSYVTKQNNVSLKLPSELSEGIDVSYNGNSVTLIPISNSALSKQTALTGVISGKNGVLKANKNAVEYKSVFTDKINLTYTPTLNGVKEEIVLEAYAGVNSWSFIANTNGMTAYCGDDGIYYFAESEDSKVKFSLGQVFVYDSVCNIDGGEMIVKELKKNDMYLITMTVSKSFLESKDTVYPVYVDPQINVDNSSTTANIIDTTVYSIRNTTNTGTWALNHAGYYNDSYGIGRILVKLPGLTSSEAYTQTSSGNITNVTFYICEGTGKGAQSFSIHAFTGANWVETTATWNNCNANSYVSTAVATATPGARVYGAFDITSLVRDWKNGIRNKDYGFILKNTNETLGAQCRAFIANNHATITQRPKVSMTYTFDTGFLKSSIEVEVGKTSSAIRTAVPSGATITWNSSNSSVATVNSSGIVTGVKVGTATITATINETGQTMTCAVWVIMADGVYYMKYNNKYLNSSLGLSSAKVTTHPFRLLQLWKIKYLGEGLYSIRTMYSLDVCISQAGMSLCMNSDPVDDLSTISHHSRWRAFQTTSGYTFKSITYGDYLGVNSDGNVRLCSSATSWVLEKVSNPPSGVLLKNTQEWIAPRSSATFEASVYSGTVIGQSVTWSSSNTNVATVSSTGVVTGKSAGTAVITAKSTANTAIKGSYTINVSELPNGTYFFKNKQTGRMLDIVGPSTNADTKMHQWEFYGHESQKWTLELQQDGYYTIKSFYSGLYLSVQGNSSADNTAIVQLSGGTATGQRWKIAKTASDAYKLTPKCGESNNMVLSLNNYVLDVNGIDIKSKTYTEDNNYKDEWSLRINQNIPYKLLAYNENGIGRNEYFTPVINLMHKDNLYADFFTYMTTIEMKDLLSYNKVFIIHTHGDKTTIYLAGRASTLTMNDLNDCDLSNLEFALLLTCSNGEGFAQSHITNNQPVNIVEKMVCQGAKTVMGFKTTTYVDECNAFAQQFIYGCYFEGLNVTESLNFVNCDGYRTNMANQCALGGNATLKLN